MGARRFGSGFEPYPRLDPPAREVIVEVLWERGRQIGLGWTPSHDLAHGGVTHLTELALQRLQGLYVGRASTDLAHPGATEAEVRERLIKVAALLVAAVEALDAGGLQP